MTGRAGYDPARADVLERISAQAPDLVPLAHALIGCDWGRGISTKDDPEPCSAQAVRRMAVHGVPAEVGPPEMTFKLCEHHHDLLESLTSPHEGSGA